MHLKNIEADQVTSFVLKKEMWFDMHVRLSKNYE